MNFRQFLPSNFCTPFSVINLPISTQVSTLKKSSNLGSNPSQKNAAKEKYPKMWNHSGTTQEPLQIPEYAFFLPSWLPSFVAGFYLKILKFPPFRLSKILWERAKGCRRMTQQLSRCLGIDRVVVGVH